MLQLRVFRRGGYMSERFVCNQLSPHTNKRHDPRQDRHRPPRLPRPLLYRCDRRACLALGITPCRRSGCGFAHALSIAGCRVAQAAQSASLCRPAPCGDGSTLVQFVEQRAWKGQISMRRMHPSALRLDNQIRQRHRLVKLLRLRTPSNREKRRSIAGRNAH